MVMIRSSLLVSRTEKSSRNWLSTDIAKRTFVLVPGAAAMSEPSQDETYSDAETAARMEAALKRALATPHKPHTASKGKRKESSQSK